MFDQLRQALSSIAKHAALYCLGVSAARKDRAASWSDASETPVRSGAKSPGTMSLPSAIPRKGSARAAWAPSSMALSLGGTSKGRTAGVGSLFRRLKYAVSPAIHGLLTALGSCNLAGHLQQS